MAALDFRDPHGREAIVLKGPWKPSMRKRIERSGITTLWINYAHGFTGDDLDFLDELPQVRELNVIARWLTDIRAIERMPNLVTLRLQAHRDAPLDIAGMRSLRYFSGDFSRERESLLDATQLSTLHLWKLPSRDLKSLSRLTQLRDLQLIQCPRLEAWSGLEALRDVERLNIAYCPRLTDLSGPGSLPTLRSLELQACKRVTRLDDLQGLSTLTRLLVEDLRIESIRPLSSLTQLEELFVIGRHPIEDRDLSPALALPHLRRVGFALRRDYSPPAEEIQAHVQGRSR